MAIFSASLAVAIDNAGAAFPDFDDAVVDLHSVSGIVPS